MGEGIIASVKTAIDAGSADIQTIGGYIIVMAAGVMVIKWIKAQFF